MERFNQLPARRTALARRLWRLDQLSAHLWRETLAAASSSMERGSTSCQLFYAEIRTAASSSIERDSTSSSMERDSTSCQLVYEETRPAASSSSMERLDQLQFVYRESRSASSSSVEKLVYEETRLASARLWRDSTSCQVDSPSSFRWSKKFHSSRQQILSFNSSS